MSDTDTRIAELTGRVWRLEQALRAHGIEFAERTRHFVEAEERDRPATSPEQTQRSSITPSSAASLSGDDIRAAGAQPSAQGLRPSSPPLFSSIESGNSSRETQSLENRIASQWFNRIGILAVLIAVAWFLKLAFENHWVGPLGRTLIGLLAGGALVAWSERFRSKGFAAFSYSLKAVGTGALYLSLWASFALYHLLPAGAAFTAMIAVTASNAVMAWIQDAELLALYAIAGALSTPALISTGENHEISLFTYLLLLDLSILALSMLKPWSRLLVSAFLGTVVYFLGWGWEFYAAEHLAPTAIYLGLFFLLFAAAPRLVLDHPERDPRRALWDQLVGTAMPIANAALGFLGFYAIFDQAGYHDSGPWLAVLFAAFYLLMVNLPSSRRTRESRPLLSALHLVSAVTFLTIAIPLKAQGRWLTIGWLAEGTALLWIEGKVRSRLLRILALICLCLGLVSTIAQNHLDASTPVFNARFGCYMAAIACLAVTAWLALRRPDDEEQLPGLDGKSVAAAAMLGINLLILLAVGWEIDLYWWVLSWKGDLAMLSTYRMYAQITYSAFFMIFGAILLALGFWRRSAFLRWQALVLLAVTIGKVFLLDINALSQGYRIFSFLGLGALLLGVSFVYQRDLLQLRKGGTAQIATPEERA